MPRHFELVLLGAALALRAQMAAIAVEARDGFTKAPVANVDLTLSLGPKTWTAQTSVKGQARFEQLAAGDYFLEYKIAGYLNSRVTGGTRWIILKDGAAETINLTLIPEASIEGSVFGEDGQPLQGVIVRTTIAEATTDREGRYSLKHLMPTRARIEFRIPAELRKRTLQRDAERDETFGYPGIEYYPGVAEPDAATIVPLTGGLELHGFDVRLRRVSLADFSGRLLARAAGEPLTQAQVELQTTRAVPPDETLQPRAVGDDGSFHFDLIPPGSYVLMVFRGDKGTGLPYLAPVELRKGGVHRDIVVPPFQTVTGAVRAKDGKEWSGEIELTVCTEQKGVADRDLTVRGPGFALDELPPGQWQIGVRAKTKRASDQGKLSVTALRFGSSDLFAGPMPVAESGNPTLEIELSNETGRIAGDVRGPYRGPIVAQRVGAPRCGPPAFTEARNGAFSIEDLAPGRYEVTLGPLAKAEVEVKRGDTAVVHLEVKQ